MIIFLCKYNAGETPTVDIIQSMVTGSMNIKYVEVYVDKWNNQKKEAKVALNDSFDFFIVYHSMKDLYSGNDYDFGQKDLFVLGEDRHKIYLPVIHLTLFDIFNPPTDSYKIPNVNRYMKVIDGSILNYYVPVYKTETTNNKRVLNNEMTFERFNDALCEVSHNTNRNGLDVVREYADLNARLLIQSHLEGSHKSISPFLFHSEHEMKEKIQDYEDGEKHRMSLKTIRKYRWRFLLLDDKSIQNLSTENDSNTINKLQIVASNLSRVLEFDKEKIWFRVLVEGETGILVKSRGRIIDGEFETSNVYPQCVDDIQIVIDCVEKVSTAETCLKQYRYEIVLLDYLLDNEYGYELLDRLREKRNQYNPGPNRRFFFMFISAFQTAVHERMLEKGFGRVERGLWFIGNGACPTNTPYLFSYQLLLMMCHRINDLKNKNEGGRLTLIELLEELYVNKDKAGLVDVRQRAHEQFNNILFMRNKYHDLEKDLDKNDEKSIKNISGKDVFEMKSSLLVQSAFQYVHHFSGAMFEHLQHLVYLTAYGTIRQWTELWEEYVFIHKTLIQYDEMTGAENGKNINKAMRDYIIDLKENSN